MDFSNANEKKIDSRPNTFFFSFSLLLTWMCAPTSKFSLFKSLLIQQKIINESKMHAKDAHNHLKNGMTVSNFSETRVCLANSNRKVIREN